MFCRFAGCKLWTGREVDRGRAACTFCDTDFVGVEAVSGGKYATAESLADRVEATWPCGAGRRFVVCTGGEPLLQLDSPLVDALHARGFEVAQETNGTLRSPPGIDWICASPKAGTELVPTEGDELKLVYPQPGLDPERFERLAFREFLLQPMDGPLR